MANDRWICPVCNGFETLGATCPACSGPVEDWGRFNDLYGPYAPYRPIDDVRLTNGYCDVREHLCIHAAYCADCNHVAAIPVQEASDI